MQDSHHETPFDDRSFEDIAMSDMVPFERLIQAGLAAVMPAHVVYPQVDARAAGYSRVWLQQVLRGQLGFQGVIFSDDINMEGAGIAGDYPDRARAALDAGCDMVLICNNQKAVIQVLDELDLQPHPASQARYMRMHGRGPGMTLGELKSDARWRATARMIADLERIPELDLGDDEIKS